MKKKVKTFADIVYFFRFHKEDIIRKTCIKVDHLSGWPKSQSREDKNVSINDVNFKNLKVCDREKIFVKWLNHNDNTTPGSTISYLVKLLDALYCVTENSSE